MAGLTEQLLRNLLDVMLTLVPTIPRFVLTMILACGTATSARATGRSDDYAHNVVFGDAYLAENVQDVRWRATQLAPEMRYVFLSDRVLPGDNHPTFRVTGTLNPEPLAPHRTLPPPDVSPFGDSLASPVFDMIDVAQQRALSDDASRR